MDFDEHEAYRLSVSDDRDIAPFFAGSVPVLSIDDVRVGEGGSGSGRRKSVR